MLFKLSMKNMKKSFKDYAIYFLTLVLGVAIFYIFNSLDSQQAMLQISESTKSMIKLMIGILNIISVFIAIVLGFLIVYANNFLINRRKKEFGIYMTLGMGKRQISKIIWLETLLIGVISLAVGIFIGIFVSQFMSILVAKLFEANMSEFTFVFSKDACIKTCIYFAIMFFAVMIFNTITISRYKLINLLTAIRKNEKVKMKNPILAILVFLISAGLLGYAYWKVTGGINELSTIDKLLMPISMGVIGTIGVFWSLSGFILKIMQLKKRTYLKGTNMFVLRQLNNKINTNIVSMSIICVMLFMTITVLSSSLSIQSSMDKQLKDMTPVDINLTKTAYLPEKYFDYGIEITPTKEAIEDSKTTIVNTLNTNGYDMSTLKDITEISVYTVPGWTMKKSLGSYYESAKAQYSMLAYDTLESVIKVSDYNKIAALYGLEQYSLNSDEYIVLCEFDTQKQLRNEALKENKIIEISGKKYIAKYDECKSGFINMSTSHTNTGIILVSDNFKLEEEWKEYQFLAANYNASTEEEMQNIEREFVDEDNSNLYKNLAQKGINLNGMTKITLIDASKGLATIVIFIAIYLGIIFLIASSAILALKQLTESSDNRQRYSILRKIGCDEKMINQALFRQIAIFFLLPLILAIVHSIFGIKFALSVMSILATPEELLPSVIATAALIGVIYGIYFLATYLESKNIIKEGE